MGERDAKSRQLLSPNETLDLAARGLVLGEPGRTRTLSLGTHWNPTKLSILRPAGWPWEGGRDAKSRHLLNPNEEPLDLASRGMALWRGAERQI